MVVRIRECKLPIGHTKEELEKKICRMLHIRRVPRYRIIRRSIDARKKPDLFYVYTIDVQTDHPEETVKRADSRQVRTEEPKTYEFPYRSAAAQTEAPPRIRSAAIRRRQEKGSSSLGRTAEEAPPRIRSAAICRRHEKGSSSLGRAAEEAPPRIRSAATRRRHEKGSSSLGRTAVERPVIIGSGPAGLFCALMLARSGFRPIVLERGEPVEERQRSVDRFWKTGVLNPSSNIQFGEGGAGTFSDGKLNTTIKDPDGKVRFVLQEFVKAGADPEILYEAKPHIGTDALTNIVRHIRGEITSLGGEVRFGACLTGLSAVPASAGADTGRGKYILSVNHGAWTLQTSSLVLAIGHSARDTIRMLCESGLKMEAKAFAVGLRVEHPQEMINQAMYGKKDPGRAGAAPYKLTHKCANGRGVYSFCMCPGGYVVNASSEPGMTAVNGMSFQKRDGRNANAAIVVTVSPEDCRNWVRGFDGSEKGKSGVLAGLAFQRELEQRAYACGKGKIPVQRFDDFCSGEKSRTPGRIRPEILGQWTMANLQGILPEDCIGSIIEGMHAFSRSIPGFDAPDVLLSGVESRTSSPVRILRNEDGECAEFPGIYPCGEGAGYAGGITSAAVDGIKTAEAVAKKSVYISTHLC